MKRLAPLFLLIPFALFLANDTVTASNSTEPVVGPGDVMSGDYGVDETVEPHPVYIPNGTTYWFEWNWIGPPPRDIDIIVTTGVGTYWEEIIIVDEYQFVSREGGAKELTTLDIEASETFGVTECQISFTVGDQTFSETISILVENGSS